MRCAKAGVLRPGVDGEGEFTHAYGRLHGEITVFRIRRVADEDARGPRIGDDGCIHVVAIGRRDDQIGIASRSAPAYTRSCNRASGRSSKARSRASIDGAITVSAKPASSNASALRNATFPPPMISARRPSARKEIGSMGNG